MDETLYCNKSDSIINAVFLLQDYLIPFEYVRTMRVLHNKAPQSNFQDVLNVIKEDLGCEVKYL